MVILPLSEFSQDTLQHVLEELVTRDGTDYGDLELSQEEKVDQLTYELQNKQAFICFDPVSETTGVISKQAALELGLLP